MLPGSKKWGEEKLRNSPASNYQGERRRGGAPGAGAEIPLQPTDRTTEEQISTLQPLEDPMTKQGNVFPEGTVACRDPMLEQVYPEGLHPVGGTSRQSREKHEGEGVEGRSSYGLTTITIPHPPWTCCGGGGRGAGNEGVNWEKGWGTGVLISGFVSQHLTLF